MTMSQPVAFSGHRAYASKASNSATLSVVLTERSVLPPWFADQDLNVLVQFHPFPGQLSYPAANGQGSAIVRWQGSSRQLLYTDQLCDVSLSTLKFASAAGVCDGRMTGVFYGIGLGGQTYSATFDVPLQNSESEFVGGCRGSNVPCTSHSQCCSQSCAPAFGTCY
jgi:hypothetical protein